jgi:hypothetical protein
MSFADWVKGKAPAATVASEATVAVANPQTPKTVFSEPENSGIQSGLVATATPAALATHKPAELPADLIKAATRYCVEIHQDGPEAVATMLADLQHYPPASWPWLTDHFRAQLIDVAFPTIPTTICCGDCRHGTATDHQAILECGLGIPSGLPIRGRWATDRHRCEEFAMAGAAGDPREAGDGGT